LKVNITKPLFIGIGAVVNDIYKHDTKQHAFSLNVFGNFIHPADVVIQQNGVLDNTPSHARDGISIISHRDYHAA
jgi:hypothetical protein